jgi:hypothetical protein
MNNKTPIKSIREHCIECSAGSLGEVLNCVITDCVLYPFRLGKNPNRKRKEKPPENA